MDLSKSKGWLAELRKEQEMAQEQKAKKRRKGDAEGLFEDEAEEESDIDDGVGNYGDGSDMFGQGAGKNDDEDEVGMKVTKEDIAAVVDDVSDDEGEGNEAELHGQMVMADDAVQLGKIARAVRKHKFRSRRSNLRSGFSRLDDFMDDDSDDEFTEEEVDEEELYLERLRAAKELKEKEIDALKKTAETEEGDAKREAEDVLEEKQRIMRMLERQVMQRTLHEHRKEEPTFLEKDEDAQAILGLVVRSTATSSRKAEVVPEKEATANAVANDGDENVSSNLVSQIVKSASSTLHARKRKRTHTRGAGRGRASTSFMSYHRQTSAGSTGVRAGAGARLAKRFVFTNTGNENSNVHGFDENTTATFDASQSQSMSRSQFGHGLGSAGVSQQHSLSSFPFSALSNGASNLLSALSSSRCVKGKH